MTISADSSPIVSSSLWEQVVAWDKLLLAWQRAARGKRGHPPTARFEFALADNLLALQDELTTRRYRPGGYTSFLIHEPKRRRISAAPFRDRVVHHALCNVIEPIMERRFHPHSYANRVGKGTHRAVDQFQRWARRYRYVLRLDVVRHFPSLDHAILRGILARALPDEGVQWLIGRILESGVDVLREEYEMVWFPWDDLLAAARPRGLPIGNLTSQFWANCYLNDFDWWIARTLRCRAYLRYVDDLALFSDSKRELYGWKGAIIERLGALRLTIHEARAQVAPTWQGSPWLGWVVYPTHRRLRRRKVVAFRRRLAARRAAGASALTLRAMVRGWSAHARHGDTVGLRRHMARRGVASM